MTRSNGPVRRSSSRRGMVIRMPRRRQYRRFFRLLYPLSPTTRLGRCFARPQPTRLTAPCSINGSKTVVSCCCPGVRTRVISLPLPSARTCSLVLNPPRLRPRASSFAESPLLPQQHAGGLAPRCHRRNALPNRSGLRHRPAAGGLPGSDPTPQPYANDRETGGHGSPWPISLRKVPPRSTSPQDPKDAVHDQTLVLAWPSRLRFLWREQRSKSLPLFVVQFSSVHTLSMPDFGNTP